MRDDVFFVEGAERSIKIRRVARMGWKRDTPDLRDRYLEFLAENVACLPMVKDLRDEGCKVQVFDQGDLGSCTANAIAAAVLLSPKDETAKVLPPSRLFIYYHQRSFEGTVGHDAGAQLRDGLKAVHRIGMCAEETWPYDVEKLREKPTSQCYEEARGHRVEAYARVPQELDQLKLCLNEGHPIVFGFVVYSGFLPSLLKTGCVDLPKASESVVGGHAAVCVGYDDHRRVFVIRNSWGDGCGGGGGDFYMPYDYLANAHLAADFWAIKLPGAPGLFQTRSVAA